MELRYLSDAEIAEADEEYWSAGYGRRILFERARARVFVDGGLVMR